jgi:hypothetical protein
MPPERRLSETKETTPITTDRRSSLRGPSSNPNSPGRIGDFATRSQTYTYGQETRMSTETSAHKPPTWTVYDKKTGTVYEPPAWEVLHLKPSTAYDHWMKDTNAQGDMVQWLRTSYRSGQDAYTEISQNPALLELFKECEKERNIYERQKRQAQDHPIKQTDQKLQEYISYAEAGNFPNDAFSMLSANNRHYWTPNIVKDMISNWSEPRTFKELENIFEDLLQHNGSFSQETKTSLSSSKEGRFTNKELQFLRGMILFTIEDEVKRKSYGKKVYNMSQKCYDDKHK